jgi:hypothetical protein
MCIVDGDMSEHDTEGRGGWRRVLRIGVPWALVWLACWAVVGVTMALVDPDSLDPGEGWMLLVVFAPMGLLTGVIFSLLLLFERGGGTDPGLAPARVVGWGVLATAIVQLAYLGHGDQGLLANVKMALLFSACGGAVTLVWFVFARHLTGRRTRARSAGDGLA